MVQICATCSHNSTIEHLKSNFFPSIPYKKKKLNPLIARQVPVVPSLDGYFKPHFICQFFHRVGVLVNVTSKIEQINQVI